MKKLTLSVFLFAAAFTGFAVQVLPVVTDTNALPLISIANSVNALTQRNAYIQAKVDGLEHRVDQLETWLLVIVILVIATLAAICLLAARDRAKTNSSAVPAPDSTPPRAPNF